MCDAHEERGCRRRVRGRKRQLGRGAHPYVRVGVGLTLNACITGLYTVAPESYPSALRTTGTGKTRVSISLVKMLMEAGWVRNVLFLAYQWSWGQAG